MSLTLIATGGTIASTRGADGSVSASLTGRELLDRLPQRITASTLLGADRGEGLSEGAAGPAVEVRDVEVIDIPIPGSWNLSTQLARSIGDAARSALESGSEGVVITHGTDVLEETAWLTELIVRRATALGPVVVTAAMRHADEFGGDGPRNLADSLLVAASGSARGRGALVCLNGQIHHARWVTKQHATALATFISPDRGPVGALSPKGPLFYADSPAPAPPALLAEGGITALGGEVAIVASHWDINPGLIPWLLETGVAGIVVEGGGAGNVNGNLADGLLDAIGADVPIVITTRCRAGSVEPIYGGKGGFATLAAAGAIGSRGLNAGKARIAMQIALAVDAGSPPAPDAALDGAGLPLGDSGRSLETHPVRSSAVASVARFFQGLDISD